MGPLLVILSLGHRVVLMPLEKTFPKALMSLRRLLVESLELMWMLVIKCVRASVPLNRLVLMFTMMPENTRTK